MALPQGYRQGIITSITVLLGFCLAFLRYWGFEAQGKWNWGSVSTLVLMLLSFIMHIYVLWRALRIKDDEEKEYNKTVGWFIVAISLLFLSFILSIWVASSGNSN